MVCQISSNSAPKQELDVSRGIPEIGFCALKSRLQRDFLNAIRELSSLLAQQSRAVIEGDPKFGKFDALIQMAQEKKEAAKYAWIAHVESHRCEG